MPVTGSSSSSIEPAERGTNPPTAFNNVDFPQPEGPISEMNEPESITSSVGASASIVLLPGALKETAAFFM